ncbi:transcriptional regulator, LacI family [Caloramator quimbayensis]|uniref:Transcriptional regulator, LacI family n=1 Tax=Caloramator quimbayensis TaxID=1147123 RepID=A0A1T4YG24_9CLOT|nr:LacI family DNA-binding transcriptional regulator [Caloramator quimbayensis]SKB00726.1 transcriptional regulator, LacI family [Caloramator quimbayensis]
MVTIYDVAREAGCSPATVSKAFNNYKSVSEKTYKKIMDTADKLGYTPNNSARALATKKTWLIGVILSEELHTGITHPHFSGILQSFNTRAGEYGYDIVFISKRFDNREISYLEHCQYRGVDGVLLAVGAKFNDEIKCILESDIKCVSIDGIYPNKYTMISDNRMGSFQALEYLYFLGHRKIAHIACPLDSIAGRERYDAYKEFLEMKGLEFNSKYVVEAEDFTHEAGKKASLELLQQSFDDLPTAVYAACDDIAYVSMTIFQEKGFRIPEDISVVGFDNIKLSEFMTPPLTTIEQDRVEIGKRAADILVSLIEGKNIDEPYEIRIPTKLIMRNSCIRITE